MAPLGTGRPGMGSVPRFALTIHAGNVGPRPSQLAGLARARLCFRPLVGCARASSISPGGFAWVGAALGGRCTGLGVRGLRTRALCVPRYGRGGGGRESLGYRGSWERPNSVAPSRDRSRAGRVRQLGCPYGIASRSPGG